MPWNSPKLVNLVGNAKKYINRDFSVELTAQTYIASKEELIEAVLEELIQDGYSKESIAFIKEKYLSHIVGKYFKTTHEIWIVTGRGDNLDTIVHEYLHSIQKCNLNREAIVDFITYKLTGNQLYIDTYELKDWLQIEKTYSYKRIKERLLEEGDCEDF